MLLAIDTATRLLGLALHDGDNLIAEQTWQTKNRHNTLLAPSINHLFDVCDVSRDDLMAVAVSVGPGSYTGLRIGIALAKGIAATRNLPLVGVSTLDMLAVGQPFQNTRYGLLAVVPAGRGRIIAAEYRAKKGRWEATSDPVRDTWAAILTELEGSYYITGEIDAQGREAIEEARGGELSLTLVDAANRLRRTGFLAQEAWRLLQNSDDPDSDFAAAKLLPFYMSDEG